MSIIYAFIDKAFKILAELNMEKMFIEADQGIYNKLLDVTFKMYEDGHDMFSKVIPRMEVFYIIMCTLKTAFSRFKDSGIIKLFVYSEISGEGTIKHALKGGNVKLGIHLHKMMFAAITRTKMIFLEKSGLFSIDENEFQNSIHLQKKLFPNCL